MKVFHGEQVIIDNNRDDLIRKYGLKKLSQELEVTSTWLTLAMRNKVLTPFDKYFQIVTILENYAKNNIKHKESINHHIS